jgi:hypothetical protein
VTGSKRSSEWYSPYFAPSTIVVGVIVIIVSIQAGRYAGSAIVERDKSRYTPIIRMTEPPVHAPAPLHRQPLSRSAKVSH